MSGSGALAAPSIDITELFQNPVRTGIQRVVRELLRHWPGELPPRCVRFEPGRGLVQVAAEAIALLCETAEEARGLSWSGLRDRLAFTPAEPLAEPDGPGLILIPEVFYDAKRCRFYEDRLAAAPGSVAMLLYDFLAYFRADTFRIATLLPLMPYLRLARMAPHPAFISNTTRMEYATRICLQLGWSPDQAETAGPVLPLGADGLRIERQSWSPDRKLFVSIGSLDGRKNQHHIAAAFMQLWDAGHDIPLVLIGTAFDHQVLEWVEAARRYAQFRWLGAATDVEVADVLRQARATIYVSEAEGFGLPPVESLAAGIPVIAAAALPSLETLPPAGQLRLAETTPASIKAAVLQMRPDQDAAALWAQAATQQLGTWRDFAVRTASWCDGIVRREGAGVRSAARAIVSESRVATP